MTALAADSSTVTFNIEYLDEGRVVGTQEGVTAETDKDDLVDMTKLPYELPAGFEMANNSDKFFIEDGDTIAVHIKHIYVNFSLQYRDEDNRILGTQKNISAPIDAEGKVDLASLSLTLPEGCTLAQAPGKLAVKNGDTVVLGVKAPPVPQTVTVNYWDVENKTAAGTGRITVDKGTAQVDTALLTDVPAGYELVTRSAAPVVDGLLYVEVKPVPVSDGRVVMNIQFKEGDTTVRGGDFRIPAGTQKYSVLSALVPEGYVLSQSGDFTAAPAKPADKPASVPASTAKPAATAQPAAKPAASGKDAKDTKAAPVARNEVVKANAPAANTSKIIPQTGLSLKSPVLLGVMMVAALAAASLYLFVIRKKLN